MKKNSIPHWIILCFTAVLILSVAASAAVNYYENANDIMDDYGKLAETCAYVASNLFIYQWYNDGVSHLVQDQDPWLHSDPAYHPSDH